MEIDDESLALAEEAREKVSRLPSFGGKLFMGEVAAEMLFPFPCQDAESQAIGDAFVGEIEALLREKLDPDLVEENRSIPKKVVTALQKMGAFAMKIPKEYGGLGFSQTNYNRVIQKVASYCGSTAVLLSAHQSIGVPQPLVYFGTEEQKRKFLPRFREGAISAFALTEPEVGSDPARMTTTAVLDGDHYIINGEKLWCTNGPIADIIVVVAKTGEKISAFIVEMNTHGIEMPHRCEFMGLGGIHNGLIRFTNVKIPKENLIDKEGKGLAIALSTINVGRLTLPAACSGIAKQCLKISRQWGGTRVQWGKPIGLHEAGSEKVAYIAATTFAMEAMTWLTSSWQDTQSADIRIDAAMAKLFCTEELWKITDLTMQLRGGRGYETARSLKARGEAPLPVERMMRDCRINTILEGTSEIMKLFLAREAIDPHLKNASVGFYLKWLPKQFFSFRRHKNPQFRFINKQSRKLSRTLFYYMVRYRMKLKDKQLLLGRLVDIGTDLFAMSAVCAYAESMRDPAANQLADHFCALARRRIKKRFKSLKDNDDSSLNTTAKRVINGEMLWLEEGII